MNTVQEFLAPKELEALRIVATLLRDEEDRIGMTRPKILVVEGNDDTRGRIHPCDLLEAGVVIHSYGVVIHSYNDHVGSFLMNLGLGGSCQVY
jgi:hypothetical protein